MMNASAETELVKALKVIAWLSSRQYLVNYSKRNADDVLAEIGRRARKAVAAAQVSA